ncbi:hypothetical protein F4813DRAFT_348674 [Daldinia decipiens]|uniref:uncharacterized protein n=1 Tax=Daldinia decipiens TaxID=326647 RepID=UPI0020C5A8EF|nr:uncharacterized protein F4813DRAFT_348674 [Daldinia decipiens]KAI1660889.1 hypothetical protein F4813DRAFT_348674 [Daldinia decipiens]
MPGPMSLTPEEAARMLSHSNDNLAPSIITCCSISLSVAITSIGLRLWSRRVLNGRFHFDMSDWLAMMALVLYAVYVTSIIMTTHYGLGRHIVSVSHPRSMSICTMIAENLYVCTLAHLKYSVLCLYRRVFSSSPRFCRWTWAVTALVTEWLLQVILATNLQCIPISAVWDPTIHDTSTCINYGVEALVAYIINITTDLIIIGMPIPLIIRLNTSQSQKCRLLIVFAVGGSACLVSLVQLRYITRLGNSSDASWDYVPLAILALVEIMVGFLATSIATYRPLYHLITKGSTTECDGNSHSTGRVTGGQERPTLRAQLSTDIRGGAESRINNSREPPPQAICVTTDVELTVQDSVQGPLVRSHDGVEPLDLDRGHRGHIEEENQSIL